MSKQDIVTAPQRAHSETPDFRNPEVIVVAADADEVACDGGHIALGHPKVWYRFDGQERIECGYCDRVFVRG